MVMQRLVFAVAALLAAGCAPPPADGAAPTARRSDFAAVLAAPGACHARSYDDAHLAAHPQQTVTRFFLGDPGAEWRAQQTPPQFNVAFGFQLKGHADTYSAVAICTAENDGAACDIEGDGGHFSVRPSGEDLRVEVTRIEVEGPNDFSPDLAQADNRVMLLHAAAASDCPAL